MKRRYGLIAAPLLLLLSIFAVSPHMALAATHTIGNANELIAAITTANGNLDADTIILTANITLTSIAESVSGDSGLPAITSNITIEGQGYTIMRDVSAPNFRILRVASSGNLTVVNTVMSNGNAHGGGAIYNMGALTIMNSTFSGNSAVSSTYSLLYGGGAISNQGTLTIINSTFSSNLADIGGAISGGARTITNSIFSGNHATVWGGAIFNQGGPNSITNSTFSNNSIGDSANSNGGAIYNFNGILTITNSTFSGNSTGYVTGAIYQFEGTVTITNSTIVGNTASGINGGIANTNGTWSMRYSTISGNSSPGAGNGLLSADSQFVNTTVSSSIIANNPNGNCSGTFTSSFSLADDTSCSGFTNSSTINLASLAENGGSTNTVALNAGSSALDAGDSMTCPSTDQRGVARGIDANGTVNDPVTGDCDIGAFESGGIIRTLQFAAATSNIVWGSTTTIPVILTLDGALPANYGPITAYVWITGGSARAGTEYAPFGMQTVVFNPGDQTKTFNINLLNTVLTSDRGIILSFATQNGPGFSGPARLGMQRTHTVILNLKASPDNAAPNRNYFMTSTPTLTWNRITHAVRYEIQAADNLAFSGASIYDAGNNLSFTWPVALPNKTYYWHVRACSNNTESSCGLWSTPDTFTVFVP